jgi:hypothetical protein
MPERLGLGTPCWVRASRDRATERTEGRRGRAPTLPTRPPLGTGHTEAVRQLLEAMRPPPRPSFATAVPSGRPDSSTSNLAGQQRPCPRGTDGISHHTAAVPGEPQMLPPPAPVTRLGLLLQHAAAVAPDVAEVERERSSPPDLSCLALARMAMRLVRREGRLMNASPVLSISRLLSLRHGCGRLGPGSDDCRVGRRPGASPKPAQSSAIP